MKEGAFKTSEKVSRTAFVVAAFVQCL